MNTSLVVLLLAATPAAFAQSPSAMPGHEGHRAGHVMDHEMPAAFGPYPMSREASGTSWQPEATPMTGFMVPSESWSAMAHGFVNFVHDDQGGPRGDTKNFAANMFMVMASRPIGPGTLGLRGMFSLDPTMGRGGYPLLLQTGETADGVEHLVDRQHPHDAFMELSGSYSLKLGESSSAFLYAGLPGEPALGPPAFMHRFSGMRNPEAPLTHHWLDSTHITMGVVTLGYIHGPWKVEASRFNGREPDQSRWNLETRKFDSSSARLTWNPTKRWSMQVSYAELESPEQISPEVSVKRTTASVMHQGDVAGMPWGTTLAWGRNDKRGHGEARKLDGWLLESTLAISASHTAFARAEQTHNDELFDHHSPLHDEAFRVGKLSVGYIHDFARTGPVHWSVGALASAYRIPGELKAEYGERPHSFMVFLQARL